MQEIKNIIESLLFIAEEPLTVEKLRALLETVDSKEIQTILQRLSDEYDQRGGGFMLREVAGGWQIRSRPEYNEWIKRLLQPSPQRLSRAALETLAVIAYKQPIIRADIEHIRGVDCGGVLRQLMERKIIRVLGRKEIAGRPLIYATTKLFLEMFDLKDLNDLPSPKEIAELGNVMIDSQQEPPHGTVDQGAESGEVNPEWPAVDDELSASGCLDGSTSRMDEETLNPESASGPQTSPEWRETTDEPSGEPADLDYGGADPQTKNT
jgi:segregation and condensation protein B